MSPSPPRRSRRGIPVLLEKPVGLTAADAEALIAAEAASKAFVLPGHILRFSAPYRRMVGDRAVGRTRRHPVGDRAEPPRRQPRGALSGHRPGADDDGPRHRPDAVDHRRRAAVGAGAPPARATRSAPRRWSPAGIRPARMWHISNAWTVPTVEIPPDRVEIVCEQGSVEMELGIAIRVFGKTPREIDLRAEPADDMLATEIGGLPRRHAQEGPSRRGDAQRRAERPRAPPTRSCARSRPAAWCAP